MELQSSTWTVVQFMEDKTVEAVPTSWLEGDICYWPPLQGSKLRKAIKKLEPRQFFWERCPVKIFKNSSFDDYVKARRKAKLVVEDTSDESSSDETMLASPPSSQKRIKIVSVTASSEEPPSLHAYDIAMGSRQQEEQSTSCSRCCANHDAALRSLQEQMHLLRDLLVEVLKEVRQPNEATKESVESKKKVPFFSRFESLQFPIRTQEQLDIFEIILKDEETFKDAVEEVHKTGGSGSYNFARRALTMLMTDELALSYSWLGRQGKKPFIKYRTASLVICAAEKAQVAGTRKDHEVSVQLWLKRAADRIKRLPKKF